MEGAVQESPELMPHHDVRLLEDSQFIAALSVSQVNLGFLSSVKLALQAEDCDHQK